MDANIYILTCFIGGIVMGVMFTVLGVILLKLPFTPESFYKRYRTKRKSCLVWVLSILSFLSAAIIFFCLYVIAVRYDIAGIIEELLGWV